MCGVSLLDRIRSEELRKLLGILDIGEMLRRARLRRFGHIMRKEEDDWVKRCMKMEVEGNVPEGRRKTWTEGRAREASHFHSKNIKNRKKKIKKIKKKVTEKKKGGFLLFAVV